MLLLVLLFFNLIFIVIHGIIIQKFHEFDVVSDIF